MLSYFSKLLAFPRTSQFWRSTFYVNYYTLLIFPNAISIEEVKAIQSSSSPKEEFSTTSSTFY